MQSLVKKNILSCLLLFCLTVSANADLTERINRIINQNSQRKVSFAVLILKADSGKVVYSHNARAAMLPASNMKLIVTAAAFDYLGPCYEFVTRIGLCDRSLVIIGSGDPLLGDKLTDDSDTKDNKWIFKDIAEALKKSSVTSINDIIADTTIFDDQRIHPNWPAKQLNRWYACEVSGLNFNGNCINLATYNTHGKINIELEPETDFVKLTNKVTPISAGKGAVGTYRTAQPNNIVVYGKCRKKQGPFAVAIERPAAFFAFLLAENLSQHGITTAGRFIEKPLDENCNFEQIARYRTPISDCMSRCNKDSFALAAEALIKTIAAKSNANSRYGSWQKGSAVLSDYLSSLRIEPSEFNIDDASGLSRKNRLSANALATVLRAVYKSKNYLLYKNSLAVGGLDGTIARYFKEKPYKGKIFGKTGYINHVKSFSGFCSTQSGDYIFSILANNTNSKTRKAINDIVRTVFIDQ
jgi:D-alanyl-D-alanine carboxypeptidase/D-alanyl-D-alanine-endopeptidase (penicillin-binding protein 4)